MRDLCLAAPLHSLHAPSPAAAAVFVSLLFFCAFAGCSSAGSAAALSSNPQRFCLVYLGSNHNSVLVSLTLRLQVFLGQTSGLPRTDFRPRSQLMHNTQLAQRRRFRGRSSARPCKRQGGSADQVKRHSKELDCTDCCSQPNSSESASSTVQMYSSGVGDTHLESSLQCEEHNQCLSSPQDSDTSAQSYQDASALSTTPVTADRPHPLQQPFTSEPTGPSLAEVPPYALTETYSIASFGEQQLLTSCTAIASALLHSSMLHSACCSAKPCASCAWHCVHLEGSCM